MDVREREGESERENQNSPDWLSLGSRKWPIDNSSRNGDASSDIKTE